MHWSFCRVFKGSHPVSKFSNSIHNEHFRFCICVAMVNQIGYINLLYKNSVVYVNSGVNIQHDIKM